MAHRTTRSFVTLALAALAVAACGGTGVVTSALVDATDAGPASTSSPEVDADPPAGETGADAVAPADASGDAVQVDGAADAARDADVPIGDCLYLNGGTCLALNPDGSPDCLASYPCSPVGHCATADAVSKPLVFWTSPQTPDARRILHVGACPEVCL